MSDKIYTQDVKVVHVLYQENDWVYVISEDSKEGFIPYRLAIILTLVINANPHVDKKENETKMSFAAIARSLVPNLLDLLSM